MGEHVKTVKSTLCCAHSPQGSTGSAPPTPSCPGPRTALVSAQRSRVVWLSSWIDYKVTCYKIIKDFSKCTILLLFMGHCAFLELFLDCFRAWHKFALVECRVTFINCKINQKTQEKTHLIKPSDNWMINFLAHSRVCSGLPGGYCCVLYPMLVIHHLDTVTATVSQSHMHREHEGGRERRHQVSVMWAKVDFRDLLYDPFLIYMH